MKALRTPNDRFDNLPDYPFTEHYLEVPDGGDGSLRMHYLDEGPRTARPLLLLHGEPSWSFLYRKMIPLLADSGYRVIVPDLIGFGKSDKPAEQDDYTYANHMDWLLSFFNLMNLSGVVLFCQDWGGLLGLRLVAENAEKFDAVAASNTMLPTGDHHPGDAFLAWQKFSQESPVFPIGKVIMSGVVKPIGDDIVAAYDAPFPDDSYKAGARRFPQLVPITPEDPASEANRAAWETLRQFNKPFLTCFSDKDPVTRGGDKVLQKLIPGCRGQAHITVENAGHFVQEDQGPTLARLVLAFLEKNQLTA